MDRLVGGGPVALIIAYPDCGREVARLFAFATLLKQRPAIGVERWQIGQVVPGPLDPIATRLYSERLSFAEGAVLLAGTIVAGATLVAIGALVALALL